MFAFLILLIPAALCAVCIRFSDKSLISVVVTGSFSALVFCTVKSLFSFMHRVVPYSFFANFFYYLLCQVLLPAGIMYAVFCFVSNDSRDFKVKSCFPLLASFYMIYLPYRVIAGGGSAFSSFELFLKPVLYLAFLAGTAECVYQMNTVLLQTNRVTVFHLTPRTVWITASVLVLVMPAVIESAWIIGAFLPVWLTLFVVYCGGIGWWLYRSLRTSTGWLSVQ